VLDNCEHVLDGAPLVADLLAAVPSLRLLATSRAPLHLRGERQYAVGPLPLSDHGAAPGDPAGGPAVRLFLERVRDVQPDFPLTAENAAGIVAICRRLDALPLALELAAPWIKVLTPGDLLRRLERDVLMPTIGPRDLPERQQTIGATVAWSYRLLDEGEQRAFRRLGALSGSFSIDAAAAVLAGPGGAPPSHDAVLTPTRPSSSPRPANVTRCSTRWRAIASPRRHAPGRD
jgi:predicted ATPase